MFPSVLTQSETETCVSPSETSWSPGSTQERQETKPQDKSEHLPKTSVSCEYGPLGLGLGFQDGPSRTTSVSDALSKKVLWYLL